MQPLIDLPELLRQHIQARVPACSSDLEALAQALSRRSIPKHGVLSRQGEICRDLYFVEQGCLRCHAVGDRGIDHVIRFAVEGWWLSDFHSYFTGEASAFGVDALEETTMVVLRRDREQRLCAERPLLANYFLRLLEGLAVATHRRLLWMMSGTVEERYEEFLRGYPQIAQRLPQHQIAAYLGVTPEALSRIRARIARR
jgi:CRP-like cAMP-binding protein